MQIILNVNGYNCKERVQYIFSFFFWKKESRSFFLETHFLNMGVILTKSEFGFPGKIVHRLLYRHTII